MKKILIIETEYEGHYLTGYIKYILRSFKNQNVKITLLISSEATRKAKGALKILKNEKVKFSIETIKNFKVKNYSSIQLLKNQIQLYFTIRKKFNLISSYAQFDHIFLTSIQKLDKALVLFESPFGNANFSGIFLGCKFHLKNYSIFHKSRFNYLSKKFFQKLLKIPTLQHLITNDHLLNNYVKAEKWSGAKKLKFLHDPKEFNFHYGKYKARSKLGLPKNSVLILVYGALIDSKGIAELLSIFRDLNIDKNIKVVLAGKQLGIMKNFLEKDSYIAKLKSEKKIFLFNNWINERQEALFFDASDIIWIGYKNYFSPSGIFYQAVQKSLPMLISNDGLINNLNQKIKVAYPVNILDAPSIIRGIYFVLHKKNRKKIKVNILKFSRISNPKNWVLGFKKMHRSLFL